MRIALYSRVSTDEQTVETQISEMKKYCEFKGWANLTIFKDTGVSGTKESRPEFDKMLDAAKFGEFDVIMVWRFDRASRSTKHLLMLLEDFNKWGVDFVSVREQIDTSTATGKLMFTMVSAFAQFERDVISDRTRAAMGRLKDQGKLCHRPRKYDHTEVITLSLEGHSPKEIAKVLNISTSHVRRILNRYASDGENAA